MCIEVHNLTKIYKNDVKSLDNINLKINNGMFGLLGQNGAGKSTLMKILIGLIKPTSGSVSILNKELNKTNETFIKSIIGYMPQEFGFYNNFNVNECLEYIAILKGLPKYERNKNIKDVLDKVNLREYKKKKYKELSGGMKRRVGLAQALIGEPQILIVDEPTAGVDPQERIRIRNILSSYSKNHTVILSTHIIEDIAITCDKLAILHLGKLLYIGTVKDIISKTSGMVYTCSLKTINRNEELINKYLVVSSQYIGNSIEYKIISETIPSDLIYKQIPPSLEDAYIYFTNFIKS